ncbi:MAG: hypothetical protein RI968_821 [Pseudomonadota bacterium]
MSHLQSSIPSSTLCIIGPTASGKSGLAQALAESGRAGPCEIISMDSALVYRGLDIGTAKPSPDDRARVRHHLIDLCNPEDRYSVAAFLRDCNAALEAIHSRGKKAIVVGGTMLYFKALRHGIDEIPSTNEEIRLEVAEQARQHGWPAMHERLMAIDPVTAARLAPNDAQRISRALEVHRATGQSLSQWIAQSQSHGLAVGAREMKTFPVVSLEPGDRALLHQAIEGRLREMVTKGLLSEVRSLKARAGLTAAHPSMRAVGYRQAWSHLDRQSGFESETEFFQRALEATRQLAKRQITWQRSFGGLERIDPQTTTLDQMMTVCASLLDRS